jgi:hypothetical protein
MKKKKPSKQARPSRKVQAPTVDGVIRARVNGKPASIRPLPKDHVLDPDAGLTLWEPDGPKSEE